MPAIETFQEKGRFYGKMSTMKYIDVLKIFSALGYDFDSFEDEVPLFDIYADRFPEWEYGYCETEDGYVLPKREFYKDFQKVINCTYDIINNLGTTEMYVASQYKYRDTFSLRENEEINSEVRLYLHDKKVNLDSKTSFSINVFDERNILEALFESCFTAFNHIALIDVKNGYVIAPTHHFSVRFYLARDILDVSRDMAEYHGIEMYIYQDSHMAKNGDILNRERCLYCHKKLYESQALSKDKTLVCKKCMRKYCEMCS